MIEILTRSIPYGDKNAVSAAALGYLLSFISNCFYIFFDFLFIFLFKKVSSGDLIPTIPNNINSAVAKLLKSCFEFKPSSRPDFKKIASIAESTKYIFVAIWY